MQMLWEITGLKKSTPINVILAELGLVALTDVWPLQAAQFWNSLASKPIGNLYKHLVSIARFIS